MCGVPGRAHLLGGESPLQALFAEAPLAIKDRFRRYPSSVSVLNASRRQKSFHGSRLSSLPLEFGQFVVNLAFQFVPKVAGAYPLAWSYPALGEGFWTLTKIKNCDFEGFKPFGNCRLGRPQARGNFRTG